VHLSTPDRKATLVERPNADAVPATRGPFARSLAGARLRALAPWAWLPAAGALAILTWPISTLRPAAGLDPSWRIALHLAAAQGLDFGHEIVFTYGPLGFLSSPLLVTTSTGVGSVIFAAVGQLALCGAVLLAALRAFRWSVALALAYLVAALPTAASDYVLLLALLGAVWVLDRDITPGAVWLVPLAGVLAAFGLLVKLNAGIVSLALFALAAWRLRPGSWRSEVVLGGSFAVSLVGLWTLTGNPLGNLPTWLHESFHVVSSYSDAMALEAPAHAWDYLIGAALVAAGAVLLFLRVRRLERGRAVALSLVGAAFIYAFFKEGFVRHDDHVVYFFGSFAIASVAFARRGRAAQMAVLALVTASIAAVARTPEVQARHLYTPRALARTAFDQIGTLVRPAQRRDLIASAKADARAVLGLDPETLASLRGHTVAVEPDETAAVWAYDLRWRPEPLLQSYLAYDEQLDTFNANALIERGPDRVLRQAVWPGLNNLVPHFEAPATFLALVCHYRDVHVSGQWEVLARTSDRCGPVRALGSVAGRTGETIRVPPAPARGDLVYARIHLRRPVLQRLQVAAFKQLRLPRVHLDRESYRLLATTAAGPLVLRLPPGSGIAPQAGGSMSYSALRLDRVPSPFTVDFFAVGLAGAGQAAPPAETANGTLLPGGALAYDGRVAAIVPHAVAAYVDSARIQAGRAVLSGWAADEVAGKPAERVLVFAGNRLVSEVAPGSSRPDVARALHRASLTDVGYTASFPSSYVSRGIRVFAVSGHRASEAVYPRGFAWRRGR
jgi:hypothetical protein